LILINSNTRQFNVPGAELVFGVVADSDAERKHFQCPRYVGDGLDLAACFIRINYRNANGKTDFYLVDDMVIDGDNITFSWLLSPKVTEYRGQVKFVMCAVGPDLKLKWHTTQGTGQVMEGLEPDNSHVESQTADVVAQLIAMVEGQTTAVENTGADQVAAVKAAAENARTAVVNEIEAKRANSLASIPNDYTALSGTVESLVRGKAGAVVCSAEGEVITLSDASDNPLSGLRIFGKSTQDGTPTPESPVDIVSLGSDGSVGATINGLNLFDLKSGYISGSGKQVTFIDDGFVLDASVKETRSCVFKCNLKKDNTYFLSFDTTNVSGTGAAFAFLPKLLQYFSLDKAFTPTEDTDELAIYINSADVPTVLNITNIQVVFANAKKDYKPFTEQSVTIATPSGLHGIPVSSGGNYTDANGQQWVCDEVDFARGVYVQRIAEITVTDGSEISNSAVSASGILRCTVAQNAVKPYANEIGPVMCDKLPQATSQEQENYGIAGTTITSLGHVVFAFEGCTSKEQAVAKLTEIGGVRIIYQLATPVEHPLSETELAAYRALHTNKPNTTILNDSGAYMSVDYTADTKLYIDNKIKEALKC
jgi:hypothetical protein